MDAGAEHVTKGDDALATVQRLFAATQKYVVKDGRIVRMVEYNIQTEPNR
jgi:hypothetical protein